MEGFLDYYFKFFGFLFVAFGIYFLFQDRVRIQGTDRYLTGLAAKIASLAFIGFGLIIIFRW